MLDNNQKFALSNNINFSIAIMDAEDAVSKDKWKFRTIGDRIKFIEALEANGFTIVETDTLKEVLSKDDFDAIVGTVEDTSFIVEVNPIAEIEMINFDKNTAWLRWYLDGFDIPNHPNMAKCGNINLPEGKNYRIRKRVGDKVTIIEK